MTETIEYPKNMGFNITGDLTENREAYQLWYDNNSHFGNHVVTKDYPFVFWLLPFVEGTVIDLGCQWGGVTQILCDSSNATVVDAIDITAQNIIKAIDYVKSPKLGRIWMSYIEDMPEDKKYDTVFFTGVLEHVLDSVKTLTNAMKLMAPNGQLLLMVPNGPSFQEPDHIREYTPKSLHEEIQQCAVNAGLHVGIQLVTTHNPEFDIEHYSWLLARIKRIN